MSSFKIQFLVQVKYSLLCTVLKLHCSNNKAEYFQSLIVGGRGEEKVE